MHPRTRPTTSNVARGCLLARPQITMSAKSKPPRSTPPRPRARSVPERKRIREPRVVGRSERYDTTHHSWPCDAGREPGAFLRRPQARFVPRNVIAGALTGSHTATCFEPIKIKPCRWFVLRHERGALSRGSPRRTASIRRGGSRRACALRRRGTASGRCVGAGNLEETDEPVPSPAGRKQP